MKKELVKKFGDILIKQAETCGCNSKSAIFCMHEVEKPECLKRLEQNALENEDKK